MELGIAFAATTAVFVLVGHVMVRRTSDSRWLLAVLLPFVAAHVALVVFAATLIPVTPVVGIAATMIVAVPAVVWIRIVRVVWREGAHRSSEEIGSTAMDLAASPILALTGAGLFIAVFGAGALVILSILERS